jgi:hypothetical protein
MFNPDTRGTGCRGLGMRSAVNETRNRSHSPARAAWLSEPKVRRYQSEHAESVIANRERAKMVIRPNQVFAVVINIVMCVAALLLFRDGLKSYKSGVARILGQGSHNFSKEKQPFLFWLTIFIATLLGCLFLFSAVHRSLS